MRIERLELDFFGHFTGQTVSFGDGTGGTDFHVIYGPNEAGKTTLMEGVLRLLYGFPHREPYDFQHQRKNLRVSAVLELGGESRHLIRRPTRGASLSDGSGTAVPDAMIDAHLGGLSLEDYRNLLCLDDDTIERGGEEIAGSKGDIGRLLFSAAAGISDLSAVLDQTRTEAEALYRKRAQTTRVAELKKRIAEVTAQIRDRDVTASDYKRLKQAFEAASRDEATLRETRAALSHQREALRAKIAAVPLLDEWQGLQTQIAPHHAYPQHLEASAEDLVAWIEDQAHARSDHSRAEDEVARIEAALATDEPAADHLQLARTLADLEDLRGRAKGAVRDLARRRDDLAMIDRDMARAALDLGAPAVADPCEMVLSPAQIAVLTDTRSALSEAAGAVIAEQRELDGLADRIATGQAALVDVAADDEATPDIAEVFERFGIDQLVTDHATARHALDAAEDALRARLDALQPGTRYEAVPEAPIALSEAQAIATQWADVSARHQRVNEALTALEEDAEIATAQIKQLTTANGPVDDASAARMRAERDRLWQAHRSALSGDSADAFKAALDRSDALADTRLSHARALGQLRELEQARAAQDVRLGRARAEHETLSADLQTLSDRISATAKACGLPETTGAEALADWIARRAEAAQAQAELDRLRARHAPVFQKAEQARAALAPVIPQDIAGFDDLIAAARRRAKEARDRHAAQAQAQAALAALRADETRRAARLTRLQTTANEARTAWQACVADHLGPDIDAGLLARSLKPLTDLRELDATRRPVARQVATMQSDQTAFADAMAGLTMARNLPPSGDPLADFEALAAIATAAQTAQEAQDRQRDALIAARAARQDAQDRLDRIDRQITAVGAAFDASIPTDTLPALRDATRIAETTIAARARLAELETALRTTLGLPDLTGIRALMTDATTPALQADAASCDAELTALDAALGTAIAARSRAARDLETVTGDADMVALAETKATLELELEDAVMRYLELSLGHRLAEEAIRRYRDVHRSGMMAATERAFAELTGGAYRTLRSEIDGNAEILVAVDATGRAKQAADMSKGTRFQLYLALRAAAYEQLAEQGTRLPFFCDDIFETFDDTRTRAACQVMGRIGRVGQAIYLTHHAHVVDIAREVCGDGVQVHHLGA